MFNIQSHYNAFLVCWAYLVSWCCLRRRKEFLQAGSLMPPGQGREHLARGKDIGEGCLWQDLPCMCVCLGGRGQSEACKGRTSLLVQFCQWGLWLIPLMSSALPSVVLLRNKEPAWAAFYSYELWVGKCQDWVTFFYWMGESSDACHSESLWIQVPRQFTLPPLKRLLHLLLVLFPRFIVVVRGRSREKCVYTAVSRPDFWSGYRYLRPSVNSLWKMRTHDLQNPCGLSGMASWEQRAIETAKVKPQMSPGKT